MNQNKAVVCPKCGKLVSDYVDQCPHCGLSNPARKAKFTSMLGGNRISFVNLLIWVNVGIFAFSYLLPLLLTGRFHTSPGIFGLPAPSSAALSILGWAYIDNILKNEWWVLVTATMVISSASRSATRSTS